MPLEREGERERGRERERERGGHTNLKFIVFYV